MLKVSGERRSAAGFGVAIFRSRLARAAGLAAVASVLYSAPAEAAVINCLSQSESSCVGSYEAGPAQSNTWKFFADPYYYQLLYTLEIAGIPTADFSLNVFDLVTDQASLEDGQLDAFPSAVCIPTYDADSCGLFQVFEYWGKASFSGGYQLTITWFTNPNPLSQPPDDGQNTILRAPGTSTEFTTQLGMIDYDPAPTPTDPVISGRGDEFSTFGAFRNGTQSIPEPATMILLGAGLAGAWHRVRRRR